MSSDENAPILIELRDTGFTVADPAEDLRGWHVKDMDGHDLGTVHALLVDSADHKVHMLCLGHGGILGFGATASFVPVQAISRIAEDIVYINQDSDTVANAPRYDPELMDQSAYYADVYGYYGCTGYASLGPI